MPTPKLILAGLVVLCVAGCEFPKPDAPPAPQRAETADEAAAGAFAANTLAEGFTFDVAGARPAQEGMRARFAPLGYGAYLVAARDLTVGAKAVSAVAGPAKTTAAKPSAGRAIWRSKFTLTIERTPSSGDKRPDPAKVVVVATVVRGQSGLAIEEFDLAPPR